MVAPEVSIFAEVLADSMSPDGARVTTMRVRYWRAVLPEVNTHRAVCKSSSSARAIPAKRIRRTVRTNPAGPVEWGSNQKGMVAGAELTDWRLLAAKGLWATHRWMSLGVHIGLEKVGLHKQVTNRVLEAHMWQSQILTATAEGWGNLFAQRCHPDAQPDFRVLAERMVEAYAASEPRAVGLGEWHLPLVTEDERLELFPSECVELSMARCARESYLSTSEGSYAADMALAQRLLETSPPHLAPSEHVCTPMLDGERQAGPLLGWRTLRAERGIAFLPYPAGQGKTGGAGALLSTLVERNNGSKGEA